MSSAADECNQYYGRPICGDRPSLSDAEERLSRGKAIPAATRASNAIDCADNLSKSRGFHRISVNLDTLRAMGSPGEEKDLIRSDGQSTRGPRQHHDACSRAEAAWQHRAMAPPENPPFDFETDEGIDHVDVPQADDLESLPGDAIAAIDRLTQLNGPSAVRGASACGPMALLAATLMTRGYAGLVRLTEALRDEVSDETFGELSRLSKEIAAGGSGATYGAMGEIAGLLQRRYRDFDGGMPFDKLRHLMKASGFSPPRAINDDAISATITAAGQCWPAKIAISGGDRGDHWILVGRDARGFYIYDPYPRADGSQIVRQGEEDWRKYAAAIAKDEDGADTIGFLPA